MANRVLPSREVWHNVWYCRICGMTYDRKGWQPDELACGNCRGGYMELAAVLYHETVADPDPLASLLIEEV